jgi:predicted ATPase
MVDRTGEGLFEAELHRLRGELLLQQGATAAAEAAEAWLHQALAVTRRQETRTFELRAATSLARLWHEQGERTRARELLAPVYGWFTEGFGTADLKDARTLLDELR